jgi:mono/diheme cytochrome c family protein
MQKANLVLILLLGSAFFLEAAGSLPPTDVHPTSPQATANPSPPPAAFAPDIAVQGSVVYSTKCASCHGAALEGGGGPALKGPEFKSLAASQSLDGQALLKIVTETMPQAEPGSLTKDQYFQVVAFILAQNGHPAGSAPLSANGAQLKSIDLSK